MAYKITWLSKARKTFDANINYLEKHWSEKEIINFVSAVDEKLDNISNHPHLGLRAIKRIQTSGLV